jgi:tetraacyldisaccharide 4'-kinase
MLLWAEAIYRRHLQQRRARFSAAPVRLGVPVISVGNLTLGGTGKTPAVQWLVRALKDEKIGIVARGYRGSARGVAVVSDGKSISLTAREAGDEPLLHAQALPGAIVVIGRDRVAAAQCAVELGAGVLILDDAFSYWSLARDFDLVLLDARRPFDNSHLLPRGRLREEAAQLQRASAVILTRSDMASPTELAETEKAVCAQTSAPLFRARHVPHALRDEKGTASSLEELRGARIGALSALADNEAFARSLESLSATVVGKCARRDHHPWREAEVVTALQQFARAGASFVVTTAKDAVKLPARDWPLPLRVLEISLDVENGDALLNTIRQTLQIRVEIDRT